MFLFKIRRPHKRGSVPQKLAFTFLAALLGLGMGAFAKFLDTVPSNEMPQWLAGADIGNFSGTLAPWAFTALVLAVFSRTPLRAAINVFAFFCGMLTGYYVYCGVFAGFWPDFGYLAIWLILTGVSPLLGFIVWFSRGRGAVAVIIAAIVTAYFFLNAFYFTPTFEGFAPVWRYGVLPLILLLGAIGVMLRRPLQSLISTAAGFALAYIYCLLPFGVPLI